MFGEGQVSQLPCFKDLVAVLFECFLIILVGYSSCRFKLISSQAKDLNSYLSTFALPTIIFLNIAQMEFHSINMSFLFTMLTAKLLTFIIVSTITLTISYPSNYGYAGALSILATQSNDFALGYPLIKSLYGEQGTEMLNYLSLMAPIQLLVINPMGIMLLEYGKHANERRSKKASSPNSKCRVCNKRAFEAERSRQSRSRISLRHHQHYNHQRTNINSSDDSPDHQPGRAASLSPERGLFRRRPLVKQRNSLAGPAPDDCLASALARVKRSARRPSESGCIDVAGGPANSPAQYADRDLPQLRARSNSVRIVQPTPTAHLVEGFTLNPNDQDQDGQSSSIQTGGELLDEPSPRRMSFLGHRRRSSVASNYVCAVCQMTSRRRSMVHLSFLKSLAMNPLIMASVVALLVNVTYGPLLPKLITRVASTVAASFAAPALFVNGVAMSGKFKLLLKSPNDLLLASVLVITKVLVLPCLMRTLALIIIPMHTPADEVPPLVDFSFLYGLLPTAPTACIIASQYNVLANVVAISMLLSTLASGPLILAASIIVNPASPLSPGHLASVMSQLIKVLGTVTLVAGVWTLWKLWRQRRKVSWRCAPSFFLSTGSHPASRLTEKLIQLNLHAKVLVYLLIASQIMIGLGGFLWIFVDMLRHHESSAISFADSYTSAASEHYDTTSAAGLANMARDFIETNMAPIGGPEVDVVARPSLINGELGAQTASLADATPFGRPYDLLNIAQRVFSSAGMFSSRFTVACLAVSMAVASFKQHRLALRVTIGMTKVYLGLGLALLVWVIRDARWAQLQAVINNGPGAAAAAAIDGPLWARLVYNLSVIMVTMPLLAFIIRHKNQFHSRLAQARHRPSVNFEHTTIDREHSRHFVTSSISLNSDTCSASTANTNLDSSASSPLPAPAVSPFLSQSNGFITCDSNNNSSNNVIINDNNSNHKINVASVNSPDDLADVTSLQISSSASRNYVDCELVDTADPADVLNESYSSSALCVLVNSMGQNAPGQTIVPTTSQSQQETTLRQQQQVIKMPEDKEDNNQLSHKQSSQADLDYDNLIEDYLRQIHSQESNRYTTFIVFMTLNCIVSMAMIAQKMLSDQEYGTFGQIESIGIVLDFGQGLLTFLAYGLSSSFND